MTTGQRDGATRIADERRRQIGAEGWTADHDDEHDGGDLAMAAACYAAPRRLYQQTTTAAGVHFCDPWPWGPHDNDARPYKGNGVLDNDDQPTAKRIRQLEKAGALIAAEIDRLLRLPAAQPSEKTR